MNVLTPIGFATSVQRHARAVALELRELRTFISVARNGNFGRAARELRISQPTVSHQIQRLEDAVGASLLLRHGRGATLTAAGLALLDRLDAVAHLLDAPFVCDEPATSAEGTLCLGLPPELAPVLLPPLVAALRASWPGLELSVREAACAQLEAWAFDRRVDVAVLQDAPAFDLLIVEPVLGERLGLVAGARSRAGQDASPVRLRALAGLPLLLQAEEHAISRRLAGAAFQHGVHLRPALRLDSLATLKEMVRNGLGCTVLPRSAVVDELARGAFVFRTLEQPTLACTHAVAWHGDCDAAVAALARLTITTMRALAHDGHWPGAEFCASGEPGPTHHAETAGIARHDACRVREAVPA